MLVLVVLSAGAVGDVYVGPYLRAGHWTFSGQSALQNLLRHRPVANQPTPELWREAALGGTGLVSSGYFEEHEK